MFALRVARKSVRSYTFLVIFGCTLIAFTLAPISITESIGTPLNTNFSAYLPLSYQAHWHAPISLIPSTQKPLPRPIPRPAHTFRPDGLLEVNPDGRHPILDLIARAEQEWDAKLAHVSQTLPEAVHEYRRRYARAPPPGFDKWWAYVKKHNVQLPDEYDQIHLDLAPFWGIDPVPLEAIQRDWEAHVHSYTLAKSSPLGPLHVGNETLPEDEAARDRLLIGANQLIDLLVEVEDDLPTFRAVFSPHDNPNVFITHDMRRRAVEAGERGEYIDPLNEDPAPFTSGWIHACPLDSVARNPLRSPSTTQKPKTFIYDHLQAMDPCAHPSHLSQHGQFLAHGTGPSANPFPVPQFSYCSSPLHADIRVPVPLSWVDDVEGERDEEGAWEKKEDERLLWRGLNTGIHHASDRPWRDSQRDRLVEIAQRTDGSVEVLVMDDHGDGEGMKVEEMKKARMNPAMLDIAFAGSPSQCEPETCRELEEGFEWRRRMSVRDAGRYKYVLDVDGNGWSSRFKRLITTNSLVFKSTVYPEWFTDRLSPWVHYIPIQIDYSDLYDALLFFRGDPSGRGAHADLGAKIARSGREWSRAFWRKEDMTAYLFRLFLEYARVMSEDRDSLNFEL
ncbi:glycosyl transferase family 90-domain-containing protein [Suillus paluster]|uniref:glycosyl transferase family 90-domain-containing protein n=1 Tax=Suillus paluster TaxID=48578 RepID=UPI001B8657D3|nr:glycosyl transferase family 90-domain-containing protein [Suillus paluster]KAG1724298.1 glycosyl transferase family 90-domain-containing protein [Suillus paluster]